MLSVVPWHQVHNDWLSKTVDLQRYHQETVPPMGSQTPVPEAITPDTLNFLIIQCLFYYTASQTLNFLVFVPMTTWILILPAKEIKGFWRLSGVSPQSKILRPRLNVLYLLRALESLAGRCIFSLPFWKFVFCLWYHANKSINLRGDHFNYSKYLLWKSYVSPTENSKRQDKCFRSKFPKNESAEV